MGDSLPNQFIEFNEPIPPGGSVTRKLVVPPASSCRIEQADPLTRLSELFLIGDEDSLFHAKTVFLLR